MGRSTTSCFKIISCAGADESVDRDDIDTSSENKGRGWSFRKKSARQRVLSNTVVTETRASENKVNSDPITITSQPQVNTSISEKTPDNIWTEEIPSITKEATVSTITTDTEAACEKDDIKSEPVVDESAILVIQAAVRRFLAQKELIKHKNVVKLQAVVRGHLVRTHAVGTLRCVQAIVKMQTLVRARRANLSAEKLSCGEKGVENPGINSQPTYVSIEKLLSNSLARQLLESTPKTKQINIKCDPSKSDSAWNWLERWMSVSTPETVESHAPLQDQEKVNTIENQAEKSTDVKIDDVDEATVQSEGKDDLVSFEENTDVKEYEEEKPQPTDSMAMLDSQADEVMDSNTEAQMEVNLIPEKPVLETKTETEPKRTAKRLATDQGDSEGRKSVFGSRKASNPAFIAAQSRFEELTCKSNPITRANSSNQDNSEHSTADITSSEPLKPVDSCNVENEVGSSAVVVPSTPENTTETTNIEPEDYVVSSREARNGGSECGTELSVTSTLDSPDQSDIGTKKFEEEAKASGGPVVSNNIDIIEEDGLPSNENTHLDVVMPETHDTSAVIETEEKPKPKPEEKVDDSSSEADIELEPKSGNQVYKSNHQPQVSLEGGSPRSHITVPESQGTPSSEISTNTKKSKTDKKPSSQKRKSWSGSKKSPVRSSVDSGLRSSLEKLPKEPKSEKRRNSFGSPRPDHHVDEEGRDNTCVPSYMQATESARLKAIANSSPKSSPDVPEKETYLKKRHSLPGAVNGRQGSPRIQRSMSQALQTTKGNTNQVTERKWQR